MPGDKLHPEVEATFTAKPTEARLWETIENDRDDVVKTWWVAFGRKMQPKKLEPGTETTKGFSTVSRNLVHFICVDDGTYKYGRPHEMCKTAKTAEVGSTNTHRGYKVSDILAPEKTKADWFLRGHEREPPDERRWIERHPTTTPEPLRKRKRKRSELTPADQALGERELYKGLGHFAAATVAHPEWRDKKYAKRGPGRPIDTWGPAKHDREATGEGDGEEGAKRVKRGNGPIAGEDFDADGGEPLVHLSALEPIFNCLEYYNIIPRLCALIFCQLVWIRFKKFRSPQKLMWTLQEPCMHV